MLSVGVKNRYLNGTMQRKKQLTAMKYDKPKLGEWIQPDPDGYKFACCDCGLVHELHFRVIKDDKLLSFNGNSDVTVQFTAERHVRSTGQIRRWMKAFGELK